MWLVWRCRKVAASFSLALLADSKSCMRAFPFPFIRPWESVCARLRVCLVVGRKNLLIYLEAAARFLQESNNWQFTNKIQIEDDANWAFANFLFYGPANTHTHTHAFTQTHTRRGRHADILYQCVHTPLGPNDAYKMQQQQFSAFFLNGNFFVVAVQQPSPPTICPPLPRIFQPHWSAFLLLLPRRAHYMESAFPLFVIVVDVFLLFCHCPHKNALILSSEKIKNVDMNAAWGNKIW